MPKPRAQRWVIALLLFVASSALAQKRPVAKSQAAQPNILLVTIDTLRADHVGCYGYKRARTPNIDSLAAGGIRYDQAYSAVPITLPSHATMMTGTYPMMHGLHDFSGNKLNPEQPTLASTLKAHGYQTGAVVASAVLDSRFGLNSGFEFYYDHFDFSRLAETNLDAMERPANQVVDEALKWLGAHGRKPFFFWLHLYDPHAPYDPPPPYATQFKDSPYDGEIAFADAQLGRVLTFLKQRNLYSGTVILLSGDHGEGLGEHGEKTHGFFVYDSTVHVPLVLKPAYAAKAQVVHTSVSLVDVMPTLLAAAKTPVPAGVQGHRLPQTDSDPSPSPLYSESYLPRIHFNWSEVRGLRRERFHFIDGPKPELYDLSLDPHELANLYAQRSAIAGEMHSQLAATIRANTAGTELAQKTSLDPAMAERLKSLGYAAVSSGADPTISDPNLPDAKDRIAVYELIAQGLDDGQHGRVEESIVALKKALESEPESVPVHYLLGLDFYKKHDFPAARQELEYVLKLSPQYALAAYSLGLADVGAGDFTAAVAAFRKTLDLDKTNHAAAFNMGAAYVQLKQIPEAVAAFRQAIAIYPEYGQAHHALGQMLMFQGDAAEGIRELERAVELAPGDPKAHADLAQAYEAAGMPDKAAEQRKAAQQAPRRPNP